jgi:Zn ribbon nucleic-acid-binding protein
MEKEKNINEPVQPEEESQAQLTEDSEDSLELEEIVAVEWQQQQNPKVGETVMSKEG